MRVVQYLPEGQLKYADNLEGIIEILHKTQQNIASVPVTSLLDLLDDFSHRLLANPITSKLEGIAFLSSWMRRTNLEKILRLNLIDNIACLDGFISVGNNKIAASPRGLVAMWIAGNVATLPIFSLVPALLTKNVCLTKLANFEPNGMDSLLTVLAESSGKEYSGKDLLNSVAVIWFDYNQQDLNQAMSIAADTKIIWGGAAAIAALTSLPRREHCTELIFGPKYSIGVIDRTRFYQENIDTIISGFVRDIAAFDQRACSAPQTIFIEKNPVLNLRQIGEKFAYYLNRLPAKASLDFYTTSRIIITRAEWALRTDRDVIISGPEANWTVCMDQELSMKEAIQSRTIFLTEIDSWKQILPLINPKIQTVGIAIGDSFIAEEFARELTLRGVVRCVRPGLMNGYESPWDGKLVFSELVRWVSLKV